MVTRRASLRDRIATAVGRLAHTAESHRRTATAFSVGVFLSFSPFLGLQIAAALLAASILRLNRLVVLAGLCANLPWIMVPWYVAATLVGGRLLGVPLGEDARTRIAELLELPVYRAAFWETAIALVRPVFWPFVIGSTIGAAILALLAYLAVSRYLSTLRGPEASRVHPPPRAAPRRDGPRDGDSRETAAWRTDGEAP